MNDAGEPPIHTIQMTTATTSLLLFSALALSAQAAFAGPPAPVPPPLPPAAPEEESEWDFGGQIRIRYERKDDAGTFPGLDFVRGAENDNDAFLFREKLHVGWKPEKWLALFVEGRGSQIEGDVRDPSPEQDAVDLQQAHIKLGDPERFPLTLTAGRQEMVYGDQRFIGIGDWSNTGRVFDAAVLRYSLTKKSWIDLFTGRVVLPKEDRFNESNKHDQFSGVYASSQELWEGVETQAFFLARNVGEGSLLEGGPTQRDVYTYGTRLKSLPDAFGAFDFAFEAAGQFGEVGPGALEKDLRAFAITGTAGYTLKETWATPRFALGYDYASGDSDAGDGRHETFEPLFGTNHSLYGSMDLVGLRNLSSPRLSIVLKPTKKLTVTTDYLAFWLADKNDSLYPESGGARVASAPGRLGANYGRNGDRGSFVGSELDIVAKYAVTKEFEAQLGYGHFFPGEYVKNSISAGGGETTGADWVYAQVTYRF